MNEPIVSLLIGKIFTKVLFKYNFRENSGNEVERSEVLSQICRLLNLCFFNLELDFDGFRIKI